MLQLFIGALIGAVIALAAYIIVQRIVLKGQKNEIIAKAEIEAEGIKKDKIHQAKEKFLQLKSEHEQYINEKNSQLKEAECPGQQAVGDNRRNERAGSQEHPYGEYEG